MLSEFERGTLMCEGNDIVRSKIRVRQIVAATQAHCHSSKNLKAEFMFPAS